MRKKSLAVTIHTECAHCGRSMILEVDSDLGYKVPEEGCRPVVFMPDVDLYKLKDDSIINAF